MSIFPNYIVTNPNGESEYVTWIGLVKFSGRAVGSKKYKAWLRQNNLTDLQKENGLTQIKFIYIKKYLETAGYKFEEI